MAEIELAIDERTVVVDEGTTVLAAARRAGADIPTLCQHALLAPYGACRLCMVELLGPGEPRLVAACVHPVAPGLVVRTRSPAVDAVRKVILELLLAHAPHAPALGALARDYGADPGRYAQEASFCIHCALCVRYCAEVKGLDAIGFIDRGPRQEVSFIPELAVRECERCKECFPLCPTSYLQAAWVLTRSRARPEAAR